MWKMTYLTQEFVRAMGLPKNIIMPTHSAEHPLDLVGSSEKDADDLLLIVIMLNYSFFVMFFA